MTCLYCAKHMFVINCGDNYVCLNFYCILYRREFSSYSELERIYKQEDSEVFEDYFAEEF